MAGSKEMRQNTEHAAIKVISPLIAFGHRQMTDKDLYQQLIIDHYRKPRNFRKIEQPSCSVDANNPLCGDHFVVYVTIDGATIQELSFEGAGCAISTASASIMTELLKGKTVSEAKEMFQRFHAMLTTDTMHSGLGKLEAFANVRNFPMRVKCATLAWHALAEALNSEHLTHIDKHVGRGIMLA